MCALLALYSIHELYTAYMGTTQQCCWDLTPRFDSTPFHIKIFVYNKYSFHYNVQSHSNS